MTVADSIASSGAEAIATVRITTAYDCWIPEELGRRIGYPNHATERIKEIILALFMNDILSAAKSKYGRVNSARC